METIRMFRFLRARKARAPATAVIAFSIVAWDASSRRVVTVRAPQP